MKLIWRTLIMTMVFMLLFSLPCFATNSFTIKLKTAPMKINDNRFYIKEVLDGRADQSNIGFTQLGLANKKVPAVLAGDFKGTLQAFFNCTFPVDTQKTSIIVKICILEISERDDKTGEYARADAEIEFYRIDGDKLGKVFATYQFIETKSYLDVTNHHEGNIRKVLEKCFLAFCNSNWEATNVTWEERKTVVETVAEETPEMTDTPLTTGKQFSISGVNIGNTLQPIIYFRQESTNQLSGSIGVGIVDYSMDNDMALVLFGGVKYYDGAVGENGFFENLNFTIINSSTDTIWAVNLMLGYEWRFGVHNQYLFSIEGGIGLDNSLGSVRKQFVQNISLGFIY